MNIYFQLFITFFKIGLFTIGGGQAMIPMITRDVVDLGWLTQEQVDVMIAIAESTPGPFAVNIATYTGIETAGVLGAVMATLGVVLPSVIIIVLVAKLLTSFMKKPSVQEVFTGVRSTVTGLLGAVWLALALRILLAIKSVWDVSTVSPDYIGMGIFAAVFGLSFIKIKGKKMKPVLIVLICAVLGVLCYGFIPA